MLKQQIYFAIFVFMFSVSLFGEPVRGYQYLSPAPDAQYVSCYSSIIVRLDQPAPRDLKNVDSYKVVDDEGFVYDCDAKIASDNKTLIFKPRRPFKAGAKITVSFVPDFPALQRPRPEGFSYSFSVSETERMPQGFDASPLENLAPTFSENEPRPKYGPLVSKTALLWKGSLAPNGVSVPSDLPRIDIRYSDNPDTGYIFMNNWGGPPYNIIFDNSGNPIWYHKYPDRRRDFKVQKNGLLTMLVRTNYPFGEGFIGMDQTYTVVDSFHAVNGYGTDEHELQVLEDGHYLLLGRRETVVDMSQYVEGGRTNATVREAVIQEFTPEHELIFQWRAWDHFDIADTYVPSENELTGSYIRFPHMNAIDIDDDGNIVLSSRHLSEVTKINRQTGEIIWRLGGPKNQFTFINDPLNGPENQHDVRALGNGRYTVFDNGNEHNPPVSRAVEYEVNTEDMTATLVWEFRDNPDKYTHWMGNHQRLPNGNRLINWADGSLPKITEVRENGELAFEMWWQGYIHTYRVFRFPWQGKAKKPYLVLEPHKESIHLIFNKFGDQDVDYYNIYAGPSPETSTLLDTARTTFKSLTNLENQQRYFFRVTAVGNNGLESEYSNEESAFVNYIEPGQNMVVNGDFGDFKSGWIFWAGDGASATWTVKDGVSHIKIQNGADLEYKVQFVQAQMELLQGQEYLFEFDAWADAERPIMAFIVQNGEPWTNYSRTSSVLLKKQPQHYSFPFKMNDPSDFYALLVFLFGGSDHDVYLDNISLKRIVDSFVADAATRTPLAYELQGSFPNPFNQSTVLLFAVPERVTVELALYNVLGQFEKSIVNKVFERGQHQVRLDANDLSSGIYFCRMTTSVGTFQKVHKVILMK